MDNKNDINEILNQLRLSEGEEFEFDEEALSTHYQKDNTDKSSWLIKVLTIFGGFLATLAFLGFLFIAGLYNSEIGLLIFGMGFIAGAIFLNKVYDKLIIETSSISIFVMGFCLMGYSFSIFDIDSNLISLIFIAIAIASLFITQNYMLSFISVLIINGCILFLIILNESYNLIHAYISVLALVLAYVFLKEAKIITTGKKISQLYSPIRIGLVFSFLSAYPFLDKARMLIHISHGYSWLSSIVTISAVLFLISILLKIIDVKTVRNKIIIYLASLLLLLPTAISPGISGAILIILLSFFVNYKMGFTLGILSFAYFISQYYYDLNFTLLVKSELLFTTGIVFTLFYLFTNKKLGTNEKS